MLDGFKRITLTVGTPYISITNNGMTFNKAAITKIGKPAHVFLMLNEQEKMIAIQPCEESDEDAVSFFHGSAEKTQNVRWNNRDFTNTIKKMMEWNLSTTGYRVDGEYLSDENILMFDLKAATAI